MDSLSYKTISANAATVTKEWVVIDATNEVLGRLASQVAKILRGKNKPSYTPHVDCGDYVIVINAEKVKLTGNKMTDKVYTRHTGYPGGQRFATPADYLAKKPTFLIEKAVKGMLPKTRLGDKLLSNLKVYAGAEHPHAAQNPKTIKLNEIKYQKGNKMDITNAEFVISNTDVRKCPAGTFPEYAFIGRSNVGKSSLINMLTGRKGLAMTSATPGKTMLINHFLINKSWYIVDLPGYGYAKRGQKGQEQIKRIIESYILQREQMTCLFVLIDSRLAPQAIDLEFTEWLGENGVPFAIVFTKADKLKGGRLNTHINEYLEQLKEQWEELPPYFITSSENRMGRKELLDYIESINKSLNSKQ